MTAKYRSAYIFMCICIICVLITGIYFSEKSENAISYTLIESDGELSVFSDAKDLTYSISDINLPALPEADRKRLQQGITVFSEEELMSLIEDFLG